MSRVLISTTCAVALACAAALLFPAPASHAGTRGKDWRADGIFLDGFYEIHILKTDLASSKRQPLVTYNICMGEHDLILHDFRIKEECVIQHVKSDADELTWETICFFNKEITRNKGFVRYGPTEFKGWEVVYPYKSDKPLYKLDITGIRLGKCRTTYHEEFLEERPTD